MFLGAKQMATQEMFQQAQLPCFIVFVCSVHNDFTPFIESFCLIVTTYIIKKSISPVISIIYFDKRKHYSSLSSNKRNVVDLLLHFIT